MPEEIPSSDDDKTPEGRQLFETIQKFQDEPDPHAAHILWKQSQSFGVDLDDSLDVNGA